MLLAAPPGQAQALLADLKKLLPEKFLDDKLNDILKEYNESNYLPVEHGNHKIIICKEARNGEGNSYADCNSGYSCVEFDHVKQTVVKEGEGGIMAAAATSSNTNAAAILKHLKTYAAEQYGAGKATAGVYIGADGELTVIISGLAVNLRNFWSGNWLSIWKVKGPEVSGSVKCRAHYFEGTVRTNGCVFVILLLCHVAVYD